MTRLTFAATRLAVPVLVGIQVACGGDSTGPTHSASSIEANSSTTITAPPGTPALELPSVIVRDENGAPLGGATVVFSVTSGGGAVSGSTVQTRNDGIATVGTWTLGQTAAVNTVDATVAGLPAVTFTANAGDPCGVTITHVLGGTSAGKLSPADCQISDGSFIDLWRVTLPIAGTYLFSESSTNIDSFLWMYSSDFLVLAQNNDASTATQNASLKMILPAGDFIIAANSLLPAETGNYTLSSQANAGSVTNCEVVFAIAGITTEQTLATSDCNQSGILADRYIIFLDAGTSITVTMTSTAIDPYLELFAFQTGGTALVATNDDADGTTKNSSLTYTAPALGYYLVNARTPSSAGLGAYTLTIQ